MSDDHAHHRLPLPGADNQWIVVHCRPRCEKKVAEYAKSKAYATYLPVVKKRHIYGKRVRVYETPLFASYLFVLTDSVGRSNLRQHDRVANVLEVVDQESLLRQLEQIRSALENNQPVELFPYLAVGTKVTVRFGPLKGIEGYVEKNKSNTRIVLNVDFIQQAIAVEVDAEWLLPV